MKPSKCSNDRLQIQLLFWEVILKNRTKCVEEVKYTLDELNCDVDNNYELRYILQHIPYMMQATDYYKLESSTWNTKGCLL